MKTVLLRLDEKMLKRTEELAAIGYIERSSALRQSIAAGLDILCKKFAIEFYKKGRFSLSESAKFADISAGEMMDLPVREGVKANYGSDDANNSFEGVGEIFSK